MSKTDAPSVTVRGSTRAWQVILWVLQVLAAVMFLFSGGLKFAGAADMVALFDEIGIGQWFRHLTGALEVLGAVLLLVPRLCALGALLLAGVMVGAVATELFLGRSPVPALVNLILVAVIAWARRDQLRALISSSIDGTTHR